MVLSKDPWNSVPWYIDAETFNFRLRETSKFFCWRYSRELLHVCVPFYRSVSIFFVAEFNFTESFFDLCLYMNYISGIQRYYVWRVMTKYIVRYILQFCATNLFSCWQSCRDGSEREGVCVCVSVCVCVFTKRGRFPHKSHLTQHHLRWPNLTEIHLICCKLT